MIVYTREFHNPDGMLYVNDVPVGTYGFAVFAAGRPGMEKSFPIIEIKRELVYGEIYLELPPYARSKDGGEHP